MIDYHHWLQRWDDQQTRYLPDREERFSVMLNVLDALLPPDFVALDLACGPGAISRRLLAHFPRARTIALDYNPVLLHLGQQTLGGAQGRITWITQSLADPHWAEPIQAALEQLGRPHLDAVLSTTALHWLPIDQLTRVYHQLGALVRPGGLLLNGDNIAYPAALSTFRRLSQGFKDRLHAQVFAEQGGEDYRAWWQAIERDWLAADPALQPLFDGYHAIEAVRPRNFSSPIVTVHSAVLADAGFDQVDTIWQRYDNRVLLAVRGEPSAPVAD